jgi:hypothetical protein
MTKIHLATKKTGFLLFCCSTLLLACVKSPNIPCHCDHSIDGSLSSNYNTTTTSCSQCTSQSKTYDLPDEEFSTITHHHVITCTCQ